MLQASVVSPSCPIYNSSDFKESIKIQEVDQIMEENGYWRESRWEADMDEGTREAFYLLIAERLAYFQRKWEDKHSEEKRKKMELRQNWERVLRERSPELIKDSEDFLDDLFAVHQKESEALYFFGLEEGIRLMRSLLNL